MTDPKKRVLEHIKEDEVIELTKKLCSFPSYSGHETECTRFLGEFMSENGLEVEYQEVSLAENADTHSLRFAVYKKVRTDK